MCGVCVWGVCVGVFVCVVCVVCGVGVCRCVSVWCVLVCVKLYEARAKILPVLYGCETWSLTLREERRLRVFENRVLRRVFGA